jgi:hypothetical protein
VSRWRLLIAPAIVVVALAFAAMANAAPPGKIRECSRVEYRTEHLEECNLQQSPFLLGGGGGPCGALCRVGRFLGGLL